MLTAACHMLRRGVLYEDLGANTSIVETRTRSPGVASARSKSLAFRSK
jgi:hypothetical protein